MNKVFLLLSLAILVGCAQTPRQPVDVALIPDDCANEESIARWLEQVANTNKSLLQTQEQYEQDRSAIKARMWRLRYRCYPVR